MTQNPVQHIRKSPPTMLSKGAPPINTNLQDITRFDPLDLIVWTARDTSQVDDIVNTSVPSRYEIHGSFLRSWQKAWREGEERFNKVGNPSHPNMHIPREPQLAKSTENASLYFSGYEVSI